MDKNEENTVFVGQKPFGNYLTAVSTQFQMTDTVHIKSRGKFTSKAVDLAEVMKNRFNATIESIETGSQKYTVPADSETTAPPREVNVSTIDITIRRMKNG